MKYNYYYFMHNINIKTILVLVAISYLCFTQSPPPSNSTNGTAPSNSTNGTAPSNSTNGTAPSNSTNGTAPSNSTNGTAPSNNSTISTAPMQVVTFNFAPPPNITTASALNVTLTGMNQSQSVTSQRL